jgi:hypothetical protein
MKLSEHQHCSVLDEIARVGEMDCEEDGLEDSGDDDNSEHDESVSDNSHLSNDSSIST